jgi:branched-chain amino acid aminotransferase
MTIWLNGDLHDQNAACLPAHNAGTLLGWGVFSTIGIVAGQPLWLERHLRRLRHDAAVLDLEIAWPDAVLSQVVQQLLQANAVRDGIARITVTACGEGRWNEEAGYNVSMLALTLSLPPRDGLKLLLSPHRIDSRRPLATIKSTSYAPQQWLWQQAQKAGFDEALLLNQNDTLCECARSNLFWVRNEVLFTPEISSGCLPGIGRELVLEWAMDQAIMVREGSFSVVELMAADEVFLTAATSGPRSVAHFQSSSGVETYQAPGPITHLLQREWDKNSREL